MTDETEDIIGDIPPSEKQPHPFPHPKSEAYWDVNRNRAPEDFLPTDNVGDIQAEIDKVLNGIDGNEDVWNDKQLKHAQDRLDLLQNLLTRLEDENK